MSEKRFESFYGYAVEDKATGKRYSDCNTEELVDLLNSLSEKNEQLRKENKSWNKLAKGVIIDINALVECLEKQNALIDPDDEEIKDKVRRGLL